MRLIDADRLRQVLLEQQAKYMMSPHEQNRHTSAGFLLAVAELDSQPTVIEIKEGYHIAEVRCEKDATR